MTVEQTKNQTGLLGQISPISSMLFMPFRPSDFMLFELFCPLVYFFEMNAKCRQVADKRADFTLKTRCCADKQNLFADVAFTLY